MIQTGAGSCFGVRGRLILGDQTVNMKKIIAAFDGLKYSVITEQYAIDFAKRNDAHLVGVFLEDYTYTSYKIYDLVKADGGGLNTKRRRLDKKDEKIRTAAVARFEKASEAAGITYSIHKDRGIAISELLKETVYADLLIINQNETLAHHPENIPTRFIRELLTEVQCPVLLVPPKFKSPDKLILLFDGEPGSVYAIKMLSYLWIQSKNVPVEVITVNAPKQKSSVKDMNLMKEFIIRHFPSATFSRLTGFAESEIVGYVRKKSKTPMIALGAYRRSKVSRWFRESMADVLMHELKVPLFVAHK